VSAGECVLEPLDVGVGTRPTGDASRVAGAYLACATCGAIVPLDDIRQLEPGRCPGEREGELVLVSN
jgi:hypothetical protein